MTLPNYSNIRVSHSGLVTPEVRILLILWHDRYHLSIEEAKDLRNKLDEMIKEIEGEEMTDDLKPCPFCGSQAKIMHGPGDDWVECMGCHCMSEMHTMESRAIEKWNRRVKE